MVFCLSGARGASIRDPWCEFCIDFLVRGQCSIQSNVRFSKLQLRSYLRSMSAEGPAAMASCWARGIGSLCPWRQPCLPIPPRAVGARRKNRLLPPELALAQSLVERSDHQGSWEWVKEIARGVSECYLWMSWHLLKALCLEAWWLMPPRATFNALDSLPICPVSNIQAQ